MRWEGNTLMPIGGWQKLAYSGEFASPLRAIHRWVDNSGVRHIAYLCEQHCYVDSGDSVLKDITPEDGIEPPPPTNEGGYGDDVYNTENYGEPRAAVDRFMAAPPIYTLDNWGQELRAMTSPDGRLLRWDPSDADAKLVEVDNAPKTSRTFVVTPERHIIVFGADGVPQQFVWCDQEDDTDWTPSTTSKAGGFYIEPAAPIVSRLLTDAGTLIWTPRMAYIIRSIGLPYVYSYEKVSECSPPISPAAATTIPQGGFWAAANGFWLFNGVSVAPVPCPIWDWIKDRINLFQSRHKATMVHVPSKFEVWYSFVGGDESVRNNYTVIYNYKDNVWSMAQIGRSCGTAIADDPNPLLANEEAVFLHESGFNYGTAPRPWIESHVFNGAGGAVRSTIHQLLVEARNPSAIQFKFAKRENPSSDTEALSGAKTIRANSYVDVRETARDFRMRVEMVADQDWSLGPIDFDIKARGVK